MLLMCYTKLVQTFSLYLTKNYTKIYLLRVTFENSSFWLTIMGGTSYILKFLTRPA